MQLCEESQRARAWLQGMKQRLRADTSWSPAVIKGACLLQIDTLFSSPLKRSADTARTISKLQSLTGFGVTPFVQQMEELTERDFGEWEGEPTARVRSSLGGCKACLTWHGCSSHIGTVHSCHACLRYLDAI